MTTESKYADTGANDSSAGVDAWSNPGNVGTTGGSYASISESGSPSQYLKGTNFGHSVSNNINGVGMTFKRYSDDAGGADGHDSSVKMIVSGSVAGNEKAAGGYYPTTATTSGVYGGSSDTWGNSLNASIINASNYGFRVQCAFDTVAGSTFINSMQSTVYYTIPAAISGAPFLAFVDFLFLLAAGMVADGAVYHLGNNLHCETRRPKFVTGGSPRKLLLPRCVQIGRPASALVVC